jgi:D-cysteine desulfhydrase
VNRPVLARLPTPLVRLERVSRALGAEIWCKRDDLTGLALTGNKVRKLEFLLAEALERGADVVLTTGGVQSNHARATAVAARQLGLDVVLLLRGSPTDDPDGNLLLDYLLGARIVWCTGTEYRERRDAILAELAERERAKGRRPYVIPEGGSNALGARGYAAAAEEIGERFDHVVVACGSGGTVAGLALGPDIGPIHGIAVCDDRAYFEARIRAMDPAIPAPGPRWHIEDGFQGPGYGIATSEVWAGVRQMAELEGLLLDPVYTGKAWWALRTRVAEGTWDGRILFWHTGGVFGLFGRGRELGA